MKNDSSMPWPLPSVHPLLCYLDYSLITACWWEKEADPIELPHLKSLCETNVPYIRHVGDICDYLKAEAITGKETVLMLSFNSMAKFDYTSQAKQTYYSESNFHNLKYSIVHNMTLMSFYDNEWGSLQCKFQINNFDVDQHKLRHVCNQDTWGRPQECPKTSEFHST